MTGLDRLPGISNYFIGRDRSKWRTKVPHYAKVGYEGVYPGIDLMFYGANQRQLEFDFIVAPGADPGAIQLGLEGAEGLEIDPTGDLVAHLPGGDMENWRTAPPPRRCSLPSWMPADPTSFTPRTWAEA